MARDNQPKQIFLDTHIVVWLYAGDLNRLSTKAVSQLEKHRLVISPIVKLELQYLYEIGRITVKADEIIKTLQVEVGLSINENAFVAVIDHAMKLAWARDPFDRIIVATASLHQSTLITADDRISKNYSRSIC